MGEDDGEMPGAPATDREATSTERCEQCGEVIETSDWYPVTTERGPDGSLRMYPFCDEGCQDAWLEDRPE